MSIPSAPSTADLKAGLNVIGRNVRTYRFKLNANWNIKPLKPLTQFSGKDFKNISELTRALNEQKGLMNELKNLKKTADDVKKTTKTANESKTLWDKFLGKSGSKFGSAVDKAADAGGVVAKGGAALAKFAPILTAMAAVGITLVANIIQGWRTDINEKGLIKLGDDVSKVLGILNQYQQRIEANKTAINEQRLSDQRTRDRVYTLEKEKPTIATAITKAKKDANDALYEVRQGRVKLDARIDKLRDDYVAFKVKAEKAIKGIDTNFQKATNTAITKLQTGLEKATTAITTANTTIKTANNTILSQGGLIKTLQTDVGKLLKNLATVPKTVPDVAKTIATEVAKATTGLKVAIDQKIAQTDQSTRQYVERKITDVTYAERTYVRETIIRPVLATVTATTGTIAEVNRKVETNIAAVRTLDNRIDKAALRDDITTITIDRTAGQIRKIEAEIDATKLDLNKTKADLTKAQTDIGSAKTDIVKTQTEITRVGDKIREQDKVNAEGNRKLDQLFPLVSGLPLIVGRASQDVINKLPTPDDLANAAATGVCRTTQPGGCMSKALNDTGNDIKTNANNNTGAVLDAVNTGANAALLAGQETILTRLGAQLPGGIGGKLSRVGEWLHLDRVLNIMIWGTTIHNALMLSNDLGQTLLGIVNNVLTLFGLKKEDGSPFDIGSVISGTIENMIKGAIGADNYTQLRETWAKASRIYQASINILNAFQGLASTILNGLEITAGRVGKIGNALRKAGEVLDNAYGWMNPQPKFNRVTQTLETLQAGASTIQMVTQAPLDVINATTEFTNATTEFAKAIKEDDKLANKGISEPEPDVLKASLASSKLASAGLELADLDLEEDE